MPLDPFNRLDLEFGLIGLVSSLKCVAALFGAARSIDVAPAEISALLDLHVAKAEEIKRLSGF